MLIRFLTGPRAGQTDHAERSQTTKLLIDAGMIEVVEPTPPRPKQPTWFVGINAHGKILLQLALATGEIIRYSGEPEKVEASFSKGFAHCLPVPENVLAEYVTRRSPQPAVGTTEAERGADYYRQQQEKDSSAALIYGRDA